MYLLATTCLDIKALQYKTSIFGQHEMFLEHSMENKCYDKMTINCEELQFFYLLIYYHPYYIALHL